MPRYLLDTNICIYIAKHSPPEVRDRFEGLASDSIAMSVVTLGELRYGIEKSNARSKSAAALEALLAAISVEPITIEVAEDYGRIRAESHKAGQPIGGNDLWIAAHARSQGWVLVTNNEREFKRVKRLKVENWVGG